MRHLLLAASLLGCTSMAAVSPPTPAVAQAAKPKPKPKPKQLFPYWENYLRIPAAERTRFQLAYVLHSKGKPMTDMPLFAVDGARREPIAIGADGRMRPPPLDFFRSKTAVIDAPGATGRSFEINMELLPTRAPAREMEAAELAAAIAQTNAGIRKAAGPIGLVAPKMTRITFHGVPGGEAVRADGSRTPLPKLNGKPYYEPASAPQTRRLVFAQTPTKMQIATTPKKKG